MKRSTSLPIAPPTSVPAIDPVCGMMVDPSKAAAEFEYSGTAYYFCAVRCKERFAANPASFLSGRAEMADADLSVPPAVAGGSGRVASDAGGTPAGQAKSAIRYAEA